MTNKFYTFHDVRGDFRFTNNRADIEFTTYVDSNDGVLIMVEDNRESVGVFVPRENWDEFVKNINAIKFDNV